MSRKNRNARRQNYTPANTRTFPAPTHHVYMIDENCSYEYTQLPSTLLESKIEYQRLLREDHVQEIVDNFDARLVNPLKVSNRDGHYYVFDGAHTLAALKQINKFDNFMVDCKLYHGLTFEDEAYLFAVQSGQKKEISKAARVKALTLAKDEKILDMEQRTEAAGFRIRSNRDTDKRRIACVAKLEKIYDVSPDLLSETLTLLMSAWRGAAWSLAANIIGGLALFIQVYGDEFSRERLVKQICDADLPALNLLRDNTSPNKDYAYAFALFKLYNKIGGKGALKPYGLYDYKF